MNWEAFHYFSDLYGAVMYLINSIMYQLYQYTHIKVKSILVIDRKGGIESFFYTSCIKYIIKYKVECVNIMAIDNNRGMKTNRSSPSGQEWPLASHLLIMCFFRLLVRKHS